MKTRDYGIAFVWLMVLTAVEVGAAYLQLPRNAFVAIILGSAAGKAMLIALAFMHLKDEKPLVWLLPGIPVLLAILFVAALFPDIVYKMTHLL